MVIEVLEKPVSAIMSLQPVVANESTKFTQVLRLFYEYPIHHLPVVDANNQLIGIVSSNDFLKVFKTIFGRTEYIFMKPDAVDEAVKITDIMSPNPITITSGDSIDKAVKIFADKKFLALPVVDNGQLVGILSARDIIGYLA